METNLQKCSGANVVTDIEASSGDEGSRAKVLEKRLCSPERTWNDAFPRESVLISGRPYPRVS